MDLFCYLYFAFVCVILSCLFLAAVWSSAGEGLNSCSLVYDVFLCFVTFLYSVLGQVCT